MGFWIIGRFLEMTYKAKSAATVRGCVYFLGWHAAKGETSQRRPGSVCLGEQCEGQPPHVTLAPGRGQSREAAAAARKAKANSFPFKRLSDGCWVPSFRQRVAHTAARP